MEYVSFVILHYKDYSVTDTCVSPYWQWNSRNELELWLWITIFRKKKKTDRNCSKISEFQNQGFADKRKWRLFLCK